MESHRSTSSSLPDWIPWEGGFVFETVESNGGYSTPRLAEAMRILYSSKSLESIWHDLSCLSLSIDGWSYLIGCIINAVDCAPENGKRATRDAPDEKIRILEQQKNADKLLKKAMKAANDLIESPRDR